MAMTWMEQQSKPAVVMFTTEGIMNYADNCIRDEMFGLNTDKLDDETWDKLINHVGEVSTDGRLEKMVLGLFDTWIGEKFNDMVYEVLDEYLDGVINDYLQEMVED